MHNTIGVYLRRFCLRSRKKTPFFRVKAGGALYNAILILTGPSR
jgi:hypothetical protein